MERHQARLRREAGDQQAERDQVGGRGRTQRCVQLAEVERTVLGVQHPGREKDGEAGQRGQHQDLERRLQRDWPLEEEAGEPVARQRRDLEPHEEVDQVRRQRRADERGEQQLVQAGVSAELARPQPAELGQGVEEQQRTDQRGGQREDKTEGVGGEADAERGAVHRAPATEVVREQPAAEDGRCDQQQHAGRAEQGGDRHDHRQLPPHPRQQRRRDRATDWDDYRQRQQRGEGRGAHPRSARISSESSVR
jgi:hypothetical protein